VSAVESDLAGEVLDQLRENFNVLIYGPPGTGKTFVMQEVVRRFAESEGDKLFVDTANEHEPLVAHSGPKVKIGWITFHQSYSYEEFIVGLRPDPNSTALLTLLPSPGTLLELAEFARQPGHAALLVIDEINRGNVSRIFGEFITLLEVDKRLDDDGTETDRTVRINLPYIKPGVAVNVDVDGDAVAVPNPFTMPRRLYTLASMNSVDKSIAPLDSALRRRFHVVELAPDLVQMASRLGVPETVLDDSVVADPLADPADAKALALVALKQLNFGIGVFLGPEFMLGEWYLADLLDSSMDLPATETALARIWDFQLFPQMAELFHGRTEQLASILGISDEGDDGSAPVYLERPGEAMAELGAVPYVRRRDADTTALMKFLRRVAGAEGTATVAAS
jgi:5-methylcytosine-specific restriction enzyme B